MGTWLGEVEEEWASGVWQHLESIMVSMTIMIKGGETESLQMRKIQRFLAACRVLKIISRAQRWTLFLALGRMFLGGTNDFKCLQTRRPAMSFPSTENQYLKGLNVTIVWKWEPKISLKSTDTLLQDFKQSVSRCATILSRSSFGSISIDV